MSKSFYIKNKKKFLFYEKVMTIKELLDIDDTKQLKTFFEYSFDDANFDHKLITKFINSDNKIKEFSEFCRNIQYLDTAIFRQKQSFYKIENSLKVYGTYMLLENFKQILPYKPNIEFPYLKKIGEKDIAYWDISFCIEKSPKKYEEIGRIYYEDFIQKLPKNKYEFIDATYILIEPLNKKEIYKILDYYELNKSK